MIMQNKDFIIKQIAYGTRQMATGKWRWWFQPQNFLSESPFMRPATADPPWPFLAKRLQQPMVTCPRNAMYISIHSSKKLHFTNLFSSQISELPATKQRGTKKSLLWEGSKPSSKNAVFFFFEKSRASLSFLIHQEASKAKVAEELPGTTGAACGSDKINLGDLVLKDHFGSKNTFYVQTRVEEMYSFRFL